MKAVHSSVGLGGNSVFSSTMVLESDDTCIVLIPVKRYYRFRYYRGFILSRNSFEYYDSNSYTTEDKTLVLVKPNQ